MNSSNVCLRNTKTRKFYIVQYQRQKKFRFMYDIVEENCLVWSSNNKAIEEVFLVDGNALQLAQIVYIGETYEEVRKKLQILKLNIYKMTLSNTLELHSWRRNLWLLLQWSENSDQITYGIWNKIDTIQKPDKVFQEFMVYVNIGGSIKQAMILDQSVDLDELLKKFEDLKRDGIAVDLLKEQGDVTNTSTTANSMDKEAKEKDLYNAHIKLFEKTMQDETTMISEAFAAVDAAKTYL